jgi:hypothetical protein
MISTMTVLQTAETATIKQVRKSISREKQKAAWKAELETLDTEQLRGVLLDKMLEDFDREVAAQTKGGKLQKAYADKAGVTVEQWQRMSSAERKAAKDAFSATKTTGKSKTDTE